jgi:hypothetical protein
MANSSPKNSMRRSRSSSNLRRKERERTRRKREAARMLTPSRITSSQGKLYRSL